MTIRGKEPTASVKKEFIDAMIELRAAQFDSISNSMDVLEHINQLFCEIAGEDNPSFASLESIYGLVLVLNERFDPSGVQLREVLTMCLDRMDRMDKEETTD